MITPAFSPTTTERVLPRLALDFTTAVLDSRVTVARALNTATRVNSSGLIQTVNADLPRFDYDPTTLQCKGLLIEETRSNLFSYSEQFDNSVWVKQDVTISANATASPDGTVNADAVTPSTTNTVAHRIFLSTTIAAVSHSLSIYAKASGYSWLKLRLGSLYANFNVSTGVAGVAGAGTTSTITNAGNGWYRCTITGTPAASAAVFIYPMTTDNAGLDPVAYAGDGTSGIFMWGAQIEVGAFATSYIPTTTTSLTRNLDVVTMTGTNFSDWFNPSQGTFVVGLQKISPSSQAIYGFDVVGAASTYSMRVRLGTDARMQSVDNGAVQVDSQLSGSVPTTPAKYAMAYKLNDYAGAADGAAVVTDTSGTVPALSSLNIGSTIVRNLYMRTIYYYPQRLINNEVQAFSK